MLYVYITCYMRGGGKRLVSMPDKTGEEDQTIMVRYVPDVATYTKIRT